MCSISLTILQKVSFDKAFSQSKVSVDNLFEALAVLPGRRLLNYEHVINWITSTNFGVACRQYRSKRTLLCSVSLLKTYFKLSSFSKASLLLKVCQRLPSTIWFDFDCRIDNAHHQPRTCACTQALFNTGKKGLIQIIYTDPLQIALAQSATDLVISLD